MRSYRVHACNPQPSGQTPYLLVSLVGANRISLDLAGMKDVAEKGQISVAITLEALYDLLQGNPIEIQRNDGVIRLCPDEDQLVIQRESTKHGLDSHRVWMAELALAWNMLSGCGVADSMPAWRHP